MLVVLWDKTNPQQKLLPFPCTLLHPSISLLCASNFHFRFLTLGARATLRLKAKQSKEVSPSGINHKSFVCICEACKAEREGGIQRYNTADANIVVNHTKVKAYICITVYRYKECKLHLSVCQRNALLCCVAQLFCWEVLNI